MKRSEMVSNLLNLHPFRTMDMEDGEYYINNILKEIERNGMLPPFDNRGLRVNKEAINYCKWEEK